MLGATRAAIGLLATLVTTVSARAASPPFAVVAHVASPDKQAAREWLDHQLRRANGHFAPADIAFSVTEARSLPTTFAVLETIRERVRLRRYVVSRVINVFVVDRILDPHPSASTRRAARRMGREPSGELAGAHSRAPGRIPGTFVLVSRGASSDLSLTHELGHFFWLPHHREAANIMSYGARRDRFDARQIRALRWMARRYRRRRTVRSVRTR
jgi:hypothetical protein